VSCELILFVGLQAAGKTSFYRSRLAETHVHISKDLWPNARNRERRQRRLIEEALSRGQPVVVDNTNPTPEDRAPLIALARAASAPVHAYWFLSSVADSLTRNAERSGAARVPDLGVLSVAKRLRPPGAEEGFDAVFTVRMIAQGEFEVSPGILLPVRSR
jgi:predicted kinase